MKTDGLASRRDSNENSVEENYSELIKISRN
jgi:hypothetical protein